MKKIISLIPLTFIIYALYMLFCGQTDAQVTGTIQKTPATGTIRGNFGVNGLDTLANVYALPSFTNGQSLKWNTSTKKFEAFTPNPTITASALTKTDDTNVTLTLGGTPSTALLQATSITAGWAGTLSGARGGTGVNNGSSTITLGGNFATSGANAVTLTTTGATNVTLPTTGTLATLAGAETFTNKIAVTAGNLTSTGDAVLAGLRITANAPTSGDGGIRYEANTISLYGKSSGFLFKSTDGSVNTLSLSNAGAGVFASTVTAPTFVGALTGNASTATSAATLTTTRTIWGQNFNGSANVSGALSGATTIDATGIIKTTATGQSFVAQASSTASMRHQIINTGGNAIWAVEGTTPDQFTGTTAYSSVIGTASIKDFFIGTNSTQGFKMDGTTQAVTLSGTFGINGTADNVKGGTYTPTLTNGTNVSSTTARNCHYTRIGNEVTVTGIFDLSPTGSGATVVSVSLPIASNLGTIYDLSGVVNSSGATTGTQITGDTASDIAKLDIILSTSAPSNVTFTFTYTII